MKRIRVHIANTFDIVKMWESWGIPMKYHGEYHFAGHAFPGGFRCLMKYGGRNQKPILTNKAMEKGVEVVNRVMVFDLLSDGENLCGAIGMDTRDEKIVVFEAKSVILGTGGLSRLYPGPTPGWFNNIASRISLTWDGRGMSREDLDYMMYWLPHEGNTPLKS